MKISANPETLLQILTPEEHELFIWLREAFSTEWIAETLMRDKREIKVLTARVYKALEVRDRKELVAYYGALGKEALPEIPKEPIGSASPEVLAHVLACYGEKQAIA
jgi:DNA-binding CsgD family transcriptional regulator